jgi:3-dehydroquinate synthase class II
MCDRVCVDLCSLLQPGEGMLVGSFARALFLVHSEVRLPYCQRSYARTTKSVAVVR